MAIRCCLRHQQHLPARAMRTITFSIYICTTHLFHRWVLIIYMLHFAHMSHHKCSFVLIPSQCRHLSIVRFGLGILPTLWHEYCFVYTNYLESLRFVGRRSYNMRRRVRRLLPSRTTIVMSPSVHSFHDWYLASRFRLPLLLYYWPSSYSAIEEYIPTT